MRDFFLGRWERYGGDPTFFPNKIIFEADPNSSDRLLVTCALGCVLPACSATKVQSNAVVGSSVGTAIVLVPWFVDPPGYKYDVMFQETQSQDRRVANAAKEVMALFSITPPMNRIAYFAGSSDDDFRYFVPSSN